MLENLGALILAVRTAQRGGESGSLHPAPWGLFRVVTFFTHDVPLKNV